MQKVTAKLRRKVIPTAPFQNPLKMESVTIPCFSVKDGLQFSVEIEPNKFIGSLVKPIAAELESVLKHRKLPADMQLYLARKGGEWLDLAGAKAVTLDDRTYLWRLTSMDGCSTSRRSTLSAATGTSEGSFALRVRF